MNLKMNLMRTIIKGETMKQIIFITVLFSSFCFIAFAQNDELPPKIIGCRADSFGRLARDDLFARLESIQVELQADLGVEAFVVIEFDRKNNKTKKVALLKMFNQYFNFRKVDRKRFTFLISESNSEMTTLWIVPAGASLEIESSNKNEVKGENLNKAINTIFKKN